MKKAFAVLLLVLLAAAAGAWYFASFRMDGMIAQRVEQSVGRSLGTRVSVGGVRTSIRDGTLQISDVAVANPPGFRNAEAFRLSRIEAAVDYGSLEVERVVIDRPEIFIEEMGGQTNFSLMLAELEKARSERPAGSAPGTEPEIVIRRFRMNRSRAAFESASLGRDSTIEVGAVELNDLRGTPSEVASMIADAVLTEITREAAVEVLKAQARRKLDDLEADARDKLMELLGGEDDTAPDM